MCLAEARGTRPRCKGKRFSRGQCFGQAGYWVVSMLGHVRKGELSAAFLLGVLDPFRT